MAKAKGLFEPHLLEVAWEVCNKVGGIHTVIQTKVPFISDHFGDKYALIGPLLSEKLPVEFEPIVDDYDGPYGKAVLMMRESGFKVEYGHWLIDGKPRVILLPISQIFGKLSTIKEEWSKYHNVLLYDDPLVDQVCAFGHLTHLFIQNLMRPSIKPKDLICHFHEWMSAWSIPELARTKSKVKTVFTTHATMLGRYLAMNDRDFYKNLPKYNWEQQSKYFYIESQVGLERLAAKHTKVMTTVSRVTDKECEYLLDRKSDIILPNGLNIQKFMALHEFQNLHLDYKKKIHEFTMGHFFGSYAFDLDKTLYFFTSGRYEFVNKGYDITLDALARLNYRMKEAGTDRTVVMLYVTRKPYTSINPRVLQNRFFLDEVKEISDAITSQISDRLVNAVVSSDSSKLPDLDQFVDDYWSFRMRKTLQSWRTNVNPIVVTHNLKDDKNDQILQSIRQHHLFNYESDKVKVVYHPDFIDSTSPLFKIDYPQFVRGCHLGIFPSYYEPWGYTPVECLASGVPAVTSDLSGFGDYAKRHIKTQDDSGIYVLRRKNTQNEEAAEALADYLFEFVQLTRRDRIQLRNTAELLSESFAWNKLGEYYVEAYRKAMA